MKVLSKPLKEFNDKCEELKKVIDGLESLEGVYGNIEEGIEKAKNLVNDLKSKYEDKIKSLT